MQVIKIMLRETAQLIRDLWRVQRIAARGPGYSTVHNYQFFRHILFSLSGTPRRCLMLGVYHARDLMMLSDLISREFASDADSIEFTGVDKFEDAACDDWPKEKTGMGWAEAGFGTAPALDAAKRMVKTYCAKPKIDLQQAHAEKFLAAAPRGFYDWIYIDTAHDYESTRHIIELARPCLKPGGILSGDDYSDIGTWGVKRAVREMCPTHFVWRGWLWYVQGP